MKRSFAVPLAGMLLATSGPAVAAHRVPLDFPTISAALAAAGAGDTVEVAAGTYAPSTNGESFPLLIDEDGVHLIGAGMDVTVLDAEGTAGVVRHTAAVGGRISGFRITGGSTTHGGGVRIDHGDVEVDHNLIVGNGASVQGAGVYAGNASAPRVHHNLILDNFATASVDVHGALFTSTATGVFEHNLVSRTDGNGLLTSVDAAPSVRHNIFYRNGISSPERGRGICWLSDADAVIFHNLFFGNEVAAVLWLGGGGDFSGVEANDFDPGDQVYGNLDGDPLFVDPDADDFHLLVMSPAVDAGDPAFPLDPDGTVTDIGPFYYQHVLGIPVRERDGRVAISSAPNPFRAGTDVRFTVPVRGLVRVDVLDASGRRIRSLVREMREAGAHAVRWDGSNDAGGSVRPGLYFVRVRAGATIGVARVIAVR